MATIFGVLSTYPPTQCGLATFSKALVESLAALRDEVRVVRVLDASVDSDDGPGSAVGVGMQSAGMTPAFTWVRGTSGAGAIAALNNCDVAIIQHEFGIFGGRDGVDVLDVARTVWVPVVVVLHTVLVTPTQQQRAIIEELSRISVSIITMTETARQRLVDHYHVDRTKVRVIPHGAAENRAPTSEPATRFNTGRPTILTWGLLGEGKGIEWAVEALASLTDLQPMPRYLVVGQTHPRVLQRHGERYRKSLQDSVHRLGLTGSVHFDDRYLSVADLQRIVRQADIVLLPYDSRDQVTSGVLIEAVSAGKPVVSTAFPHAVELLSGGAGLLVERQNSREIADALRRILTEDGLAAGMSAIANRIAPRLLWPAVAQQYRDVVAEALCRDQSLASA